MYLENGDFKYAGFEVSRYNLRDYVEDMKASRGISKLHYDYYAYGIANSIIFEISINNVQFDAKDREICKLLEEIIRLAGYDKNGVYSETAHRAMRNLCIMQGKNPEHHILYDRNISGRLGAAKAKIAGFFGLGKKKKNTPKPSEKPAPAPVPVREPAPVQKSAPKPISKPVETKSVEPQPKTVEAKHQGVLRKNKMFYRGAATVGGLALLGFSLFMAYDLTKSTWETEPVKDQTPTFKTVSVGDTAYRSTQVYNLADVYKSPNILTPFLTATTSAQKAQSAPERTVAPVATDSVSVRLTQASQSALNILLGQKKADDLCRQVQAQLDAGIFAAPRGMSVQRIAHAMTMSRIYEGKSIILDALKSKVRLTPAQQAAFEHHIDEIGDLGVKLQKRMASGHRLSTHSRYDHASKAMQKVHIKNLKQLKQMRKMARTR